MDGHKQVRQEGTRDDQWLARLVALSCFLSNISQLPKLVSLGLTQMLNMPIWIILLGYLFIMRQIRPTLQLVRPLFALLFAIIGIMLCTLVSGNSYFNSSVFTCLLLSLLIYCLGGFCGCNIPEEGLRKILWTYALSAALVAVFIYVEFFSSGFDLSSRVYAYASKNSISQIIFTSITILMFLKPNEGRLLRCGRILILCSEILLIILLRSRATLVGFLFSLIYIVAGKQFDKKLKHVLLAVFAVCFVILLVNQDALDVVFNQILFAGRDITDIDSLSSGRISILRSFPSRIEGHWLTGVGALYFECFPLSVILQFGIIVGSIILGISYLPIAKCVFYYKRDSVYIEIFVIICVAYAINSLFEGLAPIGPGAKCYFMWLLYGLILGQQKRMWLQTKGREDDGEH